MKTSLTFNNPLEAFPRMLVTINGKAEIQVNAPWGLVIWGEGYTPQAMTAKRIKQMGKYMFAKHCKNLGISAEDCVYMMYGKLASVERKPQLIVMG